MRKKCNYNFRKIYLLLVYVYLAAACPVLAQLVPPQNGRFEPLLFEEPESPGAKSSDVYGLDGIEGFGKAKWFDTYINKNVGGGGRIRAIMFDPTRPLSRFWAGGESSTLMYLDNFLPEGSATDGWKIVSDKWVCSNISCLAYNPQNNSEFYAGTGNNSMRYFPGCGIFRSTDAGATWNVVPSTLGPEFAVVKKIVCTSPTTIVVLTGDSGVYISRDRMSTFERMFLPGGGSAGTIQVHDIEYYPTQGLFYAVSAKGNNPGRTVLGHFQYLVNGSTGRIDFDTAYSHKQIVFSVASANTDPVYAAFRMGENMEINQLKKYNPQTIAYQNHSLPPLGVRPSVSFFKIATIGQDYIFAAGIQLFYTADGGSNWSSADGYTVAGDINDIKSFTHQGQVYLGVSTDRGIMVNSMSSQSRIHNQLSPKNNKIIQAYSVAVHPTRNLYYCGTQDLASISSTTPTEFTTSGDIFKVHIDYNDNILLTHNLTGIGFQKLNSTQEVRPSGIFWGWESKVGFDDVNNRVFALENGGSNDRMYWYQMNYAGSIPQYTLNNTSISGLVSGLERYSLVYPLDDGQHVLLGTSMGNLIKLNYLSQTIPASSVSLRTPMFGNLPVTAVAMNQEKTKLYVTLSDYHTSKILVSENMGNTWKDITGNLPGLPVYTLLTYPGDDKQIYIGTELNIWYTRNADAGQVVWYKEAELPNMRIDELVYKPGNKGIVAATYGRGVWECPLCGDDTLKTVGQWLYFSETKKERNNRRFGSYWYDGTEGALWESVPCPKVTQSLFSDNLIKWVAVLNPPAAGKTTGRLISHILPVAGTGATSIELVYAQGAFKGVVPANSLRVEASVDCGKTWGVIWNLKATDLVTSGNRFSTPSVGNEVAWRKVNIPVPGKINNNQDYRVRISGEVFSGNPPLYIGAVRFNR